MRTSTPIRSWLGGSRGARRYAARSAAGVGSLALLLLPGAQPADGHPFDATFYSARAVVEADPERVRISAAIEIPTAFILEEFLTLYGDPSQLDQEADELFRQRQFEKLAQGLRLRLDGRPVAGAWRPVDTEANGRGTEDFFLYLLELVPEDPTVLERQRLDLRIDLEVFPRDFIYLSATVEVEAPWRVVKNSAEPILARSGDDLYDPATGRWTVDPRLRRLHLVLEKVGDVGSKPS
ncbi:MAG: hypothetical protein MI919_41940 [Holophagales bacterium]|nr:hypothetical protein [Holophagales bacterium]